MFEFTPFKLDPDTVRLYKNDVVIDVEPQVFNVLLYLIENKQRVVSKDELIEEVWHSRTVTDSVITRIIYELRKILDSQRSNLSHIRTVRGKGYQFIAEVVTLNSDLDPEENTLHTQSIKPKYGAIVVYSLLLLLPLMVGYWYSSFSDATETKTTIDSINKSALNAVGSEVPYTDYPVVVILPIQVDDKDKQISMLSLSLIDYLTNQLELNLNMKIIHPDSLGRIDGNTNDIWSIQQATRAHYILQSNIESVTASSINIQFDLFKKDSDEILQPFALGTFEFPFPQNPENLSDLYKQRKVTVRDIISIIKPGIVINDTIGTETEDPEAYRMAIAAYHMVRSDACDGMSRAETLLLKAIERDPQFGFAYHQLFTNYFKRVWLCGDSAEYHQKALAMARIAEGLSPNTYHSLAIGRNTILVESNQVEAAYELSKDADWNDPAAIYRAVYGLRYAGFLTIASDYVDRILQLDPYYFSEKPIQQAPSTLLYQNRFDEYLSLLAEPGNSYHDYYRSLALVLSEEVDLARPLLKAVVERTPDDLFGQFSQALLYVINDESDAAMALIQSMLSARKYNNHNDGEMTYKLLQLYALIGANQQALDALQLAVNQGFFPFNYFMIDPALVDIRDTEQFNSIIQQAVNRHHAFADQFGLKPEDLSPIP